MIRNCASGISFREIDNGIDAYRAEHYGKHPNYLVMNDKTFTEIRLFSDNLNIHLKPIPDDNIYYFEYHEIPVARCNNLKYGEVDFI